MRRPVLAAVAALTATAALLLTAGPAAAHVVPSTTIALDIHPSDVAAALVLPTTDLETASGIDVPDDGVIDPATAEAIEQYLGQHFAVTSASGAWTTTVTDVATTSTEQWGTGTFTAVTATVLLVPSDNADIRSFTLDYDAIVHQVVTADVFVLLHSDWSTGELDSSRTLGAVSVDTVTGEIPSLTIDLDEGSVWQGFVGMVALGIRHIADGTDHQLFLLTLLLPAPLLVGGAGRRRWGAVAPIRRAARRITAITLAFTVGHSITLALGTLGLPIPQQAVEAAIAVSILIAAVHAVRPIFPGREALVAGAFGLVHGMAFSMTLQELDLSGSQLVLSLLGFNLGIELMQLAVVLLVLPPLLVLARTSAYRPLRLAAAAVTGVAAAGWLIDRVGLPNVVGTAANSLGAQSPVIVVLLSIAAAVVLVRRWATPDGLVAPRFDRHGSRMHVSTIEQ